jgi:hypothetical protein
LASFDKKLVYELEIALQEIKRCKGNQAMKVNEHPQKKK